MHIKRFEAPSMAEAVRKVRDEFGPDAVVLSTRTVRGEGRLFGRWARPLVELTAAVDREHRAAPGEAPVVEPDRSWRGLQISRALIEPLESEVRSLRKAVSRLEQSRTPAPSLAAEVAELRRIAAELLRAERGGAEAAQSGPADRYQAAGLAQRHAGELARDLAEGDVGAPTGEAALVTALALRLDARLAPARDDDPPVLMVVGPTGVGKTSTLAKVAARTTASPPALVSTDAHRIGGDTSLRRFARELDVPFEVAVSADGLGERLAHWRGRPVLVDTAGRSPARSGAIPDLVAMRGALGERARVHLVLSATTKESDLRTEIERYRPLQPDGLVFTKTDESGDLSNVVNVLLDEAALPLVWIANGQRVPEDLEVPDPERLALRVLEAAA